MPQLLIPILISIAATMIIVALGVFLAVALWRFLRVKQDREHTITLDNLGNCRHVYRLTVDSSEPVLKFTLLFNQLPLSLVTDPAESENIEEHPPARAAQTPARPTAGMVSTGADTVSKSGQAVAATAGKAASVLGLLGSLLPGAAGRALKEAGSKSRNVQVTSLRAARVQQTASRKVGVLQKKTQSRSAAPHQPAVSSQSRNTSYTVQTPALDSGQSLSLALRIGSLVRRYPQGSFPYTVHVQPVAIDFPETQAEPMIKTGMVHFAPVSLWRYALPVYADAIVALLTVSALVYLYLYIWQ